MTQRLPTPGSDNGTWGDILNGFLDVSLNSDGTLSTSAVSAAGAEMTANKSQPGGYASLNSSGLVPTAQLATGTASSSNYLRGDGMWVTPNSGSSSLASDTDVSVVAPSNNQVLTYNSSANKWENLAPIVQSAFGRTGAVVATSGDYTASQVTGALVTTNNLSDVVDAGSSRANLHVPLLTAAAAVAVANVSTAVPGASCDGYSFSVGDLFLLTAQSIASQNGLWTWNGSSAALTRPTEFATGNTVKGRMCQIQNGTAYGGSIWALTTATAGVVIDTSAQVWTIGNRNYDDGRYVQISNLASTPMLLPTSGIPSSSTGYNGDYAIDPLAWIIYQNTSGTWAEYAVPQGTLLSSVSYNPSGNLTYTTTSTSLTAVDTTNLAPTITAPPSGNVWVKVTAIIQNSVNGDFATLGLLSGGVQIGPLILCTNLVNFTRVPANFYITGLSAGQSYTFQLGFLTNTSSNTVTITYGNGSHNNGPVTMEITAA